MKTYSQECILPKTNFTPPMPNIFKKTVCNNIIKETTPMKNGKKFDEGKPQLALIDPKFIKELGSLMTFGAKKYAPDSWKLVPNGKTRYKNALLRHLYAYLDGELVDKESGATHLTCVAFNAMALSWFEREQH